MATPLNVLLVEDCREDAAMILMELERAGFDPHWKRVETQADFLNEIKKLPDIILSDYSLPQFSGLEAAKLLQESGLNIPFLLISGTVGEDIAVAAMKHGATDYLLKDRLVRLGNAVQSALEQQRLRQQQQQTQAEKEKLSRQMRLLLESTDEGIYGIDLEGCCTFINQAAASMLGRPPREFLGRNMHQLVHHHKLDGTLFPAEECPIFRAFKAGVGCRIDTEVFWRSDGAPIPVEYSSHPILEGGETKGAVISFTNIANRKKLEEDLRKSEVELRVTFEHAPMGVGLVRADGCFLKSNRALQEMLGYSEEELRGEAFNKFTHPDDVAAGMELFREMLAGKRDHFQIEKRYLHKGGAVIHARLTTSVVRGPNGQAQYSIGMVEDITEKKIMEAQFLRAQRMESIGTLAGGIAHDLNNVLAPILMSCELLQMENHDAAGVRRLAAMIKGNAERGADLVKQVLSFARGVEGRRLNMQPEQLIREMVNIARQTFPKSIHIHSCIPKTLWLLSGDPTQLHQVLLNLCVNARDAMPAGGDLRIAAENVLLQAGGAGAPPGATPGPHVVIKVVDTGTGIPPEVREKIFEPFFTTKEEGKGTGLGLSTTLGIIKSHGGFIQVDSAPGKGATFEVWLPAETCPEPSTAPVEATPLPRGNDEVILVVDDEASLRALTKATLETYGYVVLTAINGTDALAIYSRHKDGIAVVLTDMMMPVMDGVALTLALRQINPDVRVIIASGLSDDENHAKAIDAGAKHFLPKPYTAELLLKSLAEILHPTQPPG